MNIYVFSPLQYNKCSGVFCYEKIIAIVMVIVIISQVPVFGEESHELNIDSKSCVLMESSTGMVLYENNQNENLVLQA